MHWSHAHRHSIASLTHKADKMVRFGSQMVLLEFRLQCGPAVQFRYEIRLHFAFALLRLEKTSAESNLDDIMIASRIRGTIREGTEAKGSKDRKQNSPTVSNRPRVPRARVRGLHPVFI